MRGLALAAAILLAGCTSTQTTDRMPDPAGSAMFEPVPQGEVALRLHGFRESFEIAPVLLAANQYYPDGISIKRGGIPNLVDAERLPGYGDPGTADIATHAETQLLRYSVENPQIRAIMTVTEGDYRLVANRAAGIAELVDLAGKRVGLLPDTSSSYFLQRMLESVGLTMGDVVLVGDLALADMGEALGRGEVDALSIWEPEAEEGFAALGADAIEFTGVGIYREVFNLNTTQANLDDPVMRAKIKRFLSAVIDAAEAMKGDPCRAQQLVAQMSGHPPDLVARAWPHHTYLAGSVVDIVDVLVEEEQWLASIQGRQPRGRAQLERLVDYSLLEEVLAERGFAR